MVDIVKKVIRLEGVEYPIKEFSSWWAVQGLGLFTSLEEVSKEIPQDAINLLNIRPVPVAVSATPGVYEVL